MNSIATLEKKSQTIPQQQKTNQWTQIKETLDIDYNILKLIPGFDVHLVRNGFYSAKYFIKTNEIMQDIEDENQIVTMQIFQKTPNAKIAWLNVVMNLIKICAGEYKDSHIANELIENYLYLKQEIKQLILTDLSDNDDELKRINFLQKELLETKKQLDILWKSGISKIQIIQCAKEWDNVEAFKPVLKIKWPYKYFAKLESVYLGILARATKVATNSQKVINAAQGKPILFFADRFDWFNNQELDWYAATLAGCSWVATDAWAYYNNQKWIWTMPHALIASFNWDTAQATLAYATKYPNENVISLVDFENNCSKTAIQSAQLLKINNKNLFWVRLDTSGNMVDEWILFSQILENNIEQLDWKRLELNSELNIWKNELAEFIRQEYINNKQNWILTNNWYFSEETLKIIKKLGINWVCKELVQLVRQNLDENGFEHVKIFVSGWFTAEKISDFEKNKIPVDWYGVWSTLLTTKYVESNWDFTADIVNFNNQPLAKVWRKEI